MTQLLSVDKANEIHLLYPSYNYCFFQEAFIVSELGKEMLKDLKQNLSNGNQEKSELLVAALSSWLKKDIEYFLNFTNKPNRKMYEWDVVTSLQYYSELINLCNLHQLKEVTFVLQKDCSKMNAIYSSMNEHIRLSA